MYVHWVVMIKH